MMRNVTESIRIAGSGIWMSGPPETIVPAPDTAIEKRRGAAASALARPVIVPVSENGAEKLSPTTTGTAEMSNAPVIQASPTLRPSTTGELHEPSRR